MSLPVPIPPALRSWLGVKAAQELNPELVPVDLDLMSLVHRVLYALDECFPAWTSNQTTEILDYLYRRCELSTFLYSYKACSQSIGATPVLTTGTPLPIGNPTLSIRSFTSSSPLNLVGSTLSGVTLSWTTNQQPDFQQIGGIVIDSLERSTSLPATLTSTAPIPYTLTATLGAQVVTATTTLSFSNQVLVGVGISGSPLSSLTPLPLQAVESRAVTFTVSASPTQKVKVAFPLRLGANPTSPELPQATYTVGSFQGGFIESIVSYTNPAGFTEDYVLAESVNVNLGTLTVSLS